MTDIRALLGQVAAELEKRTPQKGPLVRIVENKPAHPPAPGVRLKDFANGWSGWEPEMQGWFDRPEPVPEAPPATRKAPLTAAPPQPETLAHKLGLA